MALKKVKINIGGIGKIDKRIMYVIYIIGGIVVGIIVGFVILTSTKPTTIQIAAQKTETPIVLGKEILQLPSYVDLKSRQIFGKLPIEIGKTGKEEPFKTIKK